jgi:hypothetical protein
MAATSLGSRLSTLRRDVLSEVPIPAGTVPERRPELDFAPVVLRQTAFGWRAGTKGVIVDAFVGKAIVEIADRRGRTLDTLTLPYSALNLLSQPEQQRERELVH